MSLPDRFVAKLVIGDCWEWVGAKSDGYGIFRLSGSGSGFGTTPTRVVYAHRFAYETLVGPVAPGLVVDHLCRNPACVNPDHLEPVTRLENARRGIRGAMLRRNQGDPYARRAA